MSLRPLHAGAALFVVASSFGLSSLASAKTVADPLALHGHPVSTVDFSLSVSYNSLQAVKGVVKLNVAHPSLTGQLSIPLLTAATALNVLDVNNTLYYSSPNLGSKTWYRTPQRLGSLAVVSSLLAHPKTGALLLAGAKPVHHGPFTTYSATVNPAVATVLVGTTLPVKNVKNVLVSETVGAGGEVTALSVGLVTSTGAHTTIAAQVISYNKPLVVVAPKHSLAGQALGSLAGSFGASGFPTTSTTKAKG